MIRSDQIPDEVVEAAAKVIADANGWREKNSVSICKPVAVEAIAAALSAWPRWKGCWDEDETGLYRCLLLPLPQGAGDE